jgi:hypothetical protein
MPIPTRLQGGASREPVAGFIGFFAYFRLSLIDARTWRVVREVDIAESRVHGERSPSRSASR